MFNKKVLSVAVACAATGISVSAMAAFNVSDDDLTTEIAIANESIAPTTTGVLPVGVGDTTGALDVEGLIQVGVPANDQIYIRYDWTGGTLLSDLPQGAVDVDGTASTSLTDGLTGDTSAVFGVLAGGAGFNQTASVTLDFQNPSLGIGLTGSSLDVRMRVYTDQGNALAGGPALSDQTASGVVSIADALDIDFTPANATAEVQTGFTEFVDGASTSTTGVLGLFTADALTGFSLASDLSAATFANLVDATSNSTVTYSGNFGFNTSSGFYVSGATDGTCDPSGSTALVPDTASFSMATIDMADGNGRALCATVDGDEEVIPNAAYTATVVLTHAETNSSPSATTATSSVGNIVRNGTTVEVAYVTTFADYNQRLLLNSRSGVDVTYEITFRTEDGVTATELPAASGTLPAGENLVLRMTDLVEFEGGSRGAATVTVVAPSSDIDVATTQVNLADSSTDTVYWSVK